MRKYKRMTVVVAGVLAVSLLAGCAQTKGDGKVESKGEEKTETQETEALKKAEKPKLPLVEPGKETLTIATMDNWFATKSYNDNLPVYEEFEKLTGVKIVWEAIPINDYDQVMGTRLASGKNLPDIFVIPWEANADQLGFDGIAMPLNQLMDKNAYYLNQLMDKYPVVRSGITAADGNIYAYPGFGEGFINTAEELESGELTDPGANVCPNVSMIRKDWLDKLNLEVPETLDDWYNVLKAFKTQDPNGNGKADEIPLTATFNVRDIYRFGEAFGLYRSGNAECRWDVGEDGKVFFKDTTDGFKKTLEFLNKLYVEGLLDPEYATAGYDKTSEKISRDLLGSLSSDWMSNIATYNGNLKTAGVEDANWVAVQPIKNPEGKSMITNRWSVWKTAAISKDCKNPELAMKWLDFQTLSAEGVALTNFGVEDVSYTKSEDGKITLTQDAVNNPDGIGAQEYLRSLGAWGQLPYPQAKEGYEVLWADQPEIIEFANSFTSAQIRQPFPNSGTKAALAFTDDENAIRTEVETNIETYCDEMAIKFIEGKESLDKFDEYVATVESYGLSQLLEVHQSAYERFAAN